MASTIQQFLAAHLDAYRRQNLAAIVSQYASSCIVADPQGQRLLSTPAEVESYVRETLAAQAEAGLTAERLTVRSLLLLGDDFAVANVAWSMLGTSRNLRNVHVAYNVRRDGGNWSIWAVTAHESLRP